MEIAAEVFEPLESSSVPAFVFRQFDRAEFTACTQLSFGGRHSLPDIFLNLALQVEVHLRIHPLFPARPLPEIWPVHEGAPIPRPRGPGRWPRIAGSSHPSPARVVCAGKAVVFGFVPALSRIPFGLEPAFALKPVERGVKRPLPNMQGVLRNLLKPLNDSVTVYRLECANFQDQHVERPLEKLGIAWRVGLPRHSRYKHTLECLECQGTTQQKERGRRVYRTTTFAAA